MTIITYGVYQINSKLHIFVCKRFEPHNTQTLSLYLYIRFLKSYKIKHLVLSKFLSIIKNEKSIC